MHIIRIVKYFLKNNHTEPHKTKKTLKLYHLPKRSGRFSQRAPSVRR